MLTHDGCVHFRRPERLLRRWLHETDAVDRRTVHGVLRVGVAERVRHVRVPAAEDEPLVARGVLRPLADVATHVEGARAAHPTEGAPFLERLAAEVASRDDAIPELR